MFFPLVLSNQNLMSYPLKEGLETVSFLSRKNVSLSPMQYYLPLFSANRIISIFVPKTLSDHIVCLSDLRMQRVILML